MKNLIAAAFLMSNFFGLANAADNSNKIVGLFAGHWQGQMSASLAGEGEETFDWNMTCSEIALGRGVFCDISGTPSFGNISEPCMLSTSQEDGLVHYMCVSSLGEVHDHKGKWINDTTLVFEPFTVSSVKVPYTENITWSFSGDKSVKTTTVTNKEGAEVSKFVMIVTKLPSN